MPLLPTRARSTKTTAGPFASGGRAFFAHRCALDRQLSQRTATGCEGEIKKGKKKEKFLGSGAVPAQLSTLNMRPHREAKRGNRKGRIQTAPPPPHEIRTAPCIC